MEGGSSSGKMELTMACVHCGYSTRSIFIQYSPGNIRLSKCGRCQFPVDEYVEYEIMIVIIDVILHKPEAYRHLFFNYPHLHHLRVLDLVWKVSLVGLLLDTCRCALHGVGNAKIIQWDSLVSFLSTAGRVLSQVTFINAAFLSFIMLASRAWLGRGPEETIPPRPADVIMAVALSNHFKLFVFVMLVWEFSPFMGFMVDMLVLSSNVVALKVTSNTGTLQIFVVVLTATLLKIVLGALVGLPGLDPFQIRSFTGQEL